MLVNNRNIEGRQQAEQIPAVKNREDIAGSTYEVDVLNQFKANMSQLEDLHLRLKFVLSEVSSLIKKR